MKFVSEVVGSHNIQQQNVFGAGIQTGDAEFHLREHLPEIGIQSQSHLHIQLNLWE